MTVAKQQGSRVLVDAYKVIEPGLDISSWFTTDKFLEDNAATADKFLLCLDKARHFATDNPDKVRAFLPQFMKVTPELAQATQLGVWPEGLPKQESVKGIYDTAIRHGLLSKDALPDVSQMLYRK